jgi:hypothetical protein
MKEDEDEEEDAEEDEEDEEDGGEEEEEGRPSGTGVMRQRPTKESGLLAAS